MESSKAGRVIIIKNIGNPADKFSCQALKLAPQVDSMILGWIQSANGGAISSGSRNNYTIANYHSLLKNPHYPEQKGQMKV